MVSEIDIHKRIYVNPNIVIVAISDGFYSIANPYIKNGLKVINCRQKKTLDLFAKGESIARVTELSKESIEDVVYFYRLLLDKQYVSDVPVFKEPCWKKTTDTLNLWVQTTNDCNLRCSYCYIHTLGQHDFFSSDRLDVFEQSLLTTVKNNNLKLVQLRLAGGEPLLRYSLWEPFFPKLRRKLSDLGCKLNLAFLSNGVAINDRIMDFMKENAIGIGISIDGLGKYQDATRHFLNGNGSFSIVSKNIEKLVSRGFRPSLMTVITDKNIDGLTDFTHYVIDSKLHTRYSFVSGENLNINKMIAALKECYSIFEMAIENGYSFTRLHQLCDLKIDNPWFQTCSDGYNGGAIYTDGGVYFCQRHFGAISPLGSIYEDSDLLSIIRRKDYYSDVSKDCIKCKFHYICTSGCPIERVNGKDPHCEAYKELIPILYRLRGKEHLYRIKKEQ